MFIRLYQANKQNFVRSEIPGYVIITIIIQSKDNYLWDNYIIGVIFIESLLL